MASGGRWSTQRNGESDEIEVGIGGDAGFKVQSPAKASPCRTPPLRTRPQHHLTCSTFHAFVPRFVRESPCCFASFASRTSSKASLKDTRERVQKHLTTKKNPCRGGDGPYKWSCQNCQDGWNRIDSWKRHRCTGAQGVRSVSLGRRLKGRVRNEV